jgi:NAD-dependent deacetylase
VVPNAGHRAVADLERQGRLLALVTQNVDGLDQAAGSSRNGVLEVHGTVHELKDPPAPHRSHARGGPLQAGRVLD